eukprot:scaffold3243_cov173-Ochromonas_danica.AAC.43
MSSLGWSSSDCRTSKIIVRADLEQSQEQYLNDLIQSCSSISWNRVSQSDSVAANDHQIVQSLFVWFEGQSLGEGAQHQREKCKYNLMLFPPTATDASKKNTFLLNTFLAKISLDYPRKAVELEAGEWSHFLALTVPDVAANLGLLPEVCKGVDALELRVDLLNDRSSENVHRQLSYIRSVSPLPIVFTVRTKGQIGSYPDEDFDGIERLLLEGVKAGVEWLDVEASLPESLKEKIVTAVGDKQVTRILGSLHTRDTQSEDNILQLFKQTDLNGAADILKLVTGASGDEDSLRIHRVGQNMPKPYIGLCLGKEGQLSRMLNRRFTPVTHALMAIAAPGQLSAEELVNRRLQSGLICPKRFFLFGIPIQHSLSPLMHNAAFESLFMPHKYELAERSDVASYVDLLQNAHFGGASVTIPHKESIKFYLNSTSDMAQQIGAVNTIVLDDDGCKVGYNTDWIGIFRPLSRKLKALVNSGDGRRNIGLVVGAGGTARAACFAIKRLGLELRVANRDFEKASALAQRFNGSAVRMEHLREFIEPDEVLVSTIPAAANFTVPDDLLNYHRPAVLDVVYKPALTPLLRQHRTRGDDVARTRNRAV